MILARILIFLIPLFGILGLAYTFWRSGWVARQDAGNERMGTIAAASPTTSPALAW